MWRMCGHPSCFENGAELNVFVKWLRHYCMTKAWKDSDFAWSTALWHFCCIICIIMVYIHLAHLCSYFGHMSGHVSSWVSFRPHQRKDVGRHPEDGTSRGFPWVFGRPETRVLRGRSMAQGTYGVPHFPVEIHRTGHRTGPFLQPFQFNLAVHNMTGRDEELILRMGQEGMSVELISKVLQLNSDAVRQTLEGSEVVKDSYFPEVQELLRDPVELCCPISLELMEDPVIAPDGHTYERSFIKCSLEGKRESPMTKEPIHDLVFFPNRDKKSAIVIYREAVVQSVLSMKQKLLSTSRIDEALKLLDKAELFVRSVLPDAAARRKLVHLLLIRVRLLGAGRDSVILEIVVLLIEMEDTNQIPKFLGEIEEEEFLSLLAKLEDERVARLREMQTSSSLSLCRKDTIDLQLARRLIKYVSDDGRLKELWSLLLLHSQDYSWVKAAAVFLASFCERLDVDLKRLHEQVLLHVCRCLNDKAVAISIAYDFFHCDLGISSATTWPARGSASIILEMAIRATDHQQKLSLLLRAYRINPGNQFLRSAIATHLAEFLEAREAGECAEGEALLLKLLLENNQEVPDDLIQRLTLTDAQLEELSADQLMSLAYQIGAKRRRLDGSQVAVKAAKLFESMHSEEKAQDAFLQAFSLDRSNEHAANGLIQAVVALKDRCRILEKSCQDRSVMSFVWDLSCYDFKGFRKGQRQTSDLLPLSCWGMNAWISLYPAGEEGSLSGKASLHLHFQNVGYVRGKIRGGNQADAQFSLDRQSKWVRRNFMDTSEILLHGACITLQILSVQLPTLQLGRSGRLPEE